MNLRRIIRPLLLKEGVAGGEGGREGWEEKGARSEGRKKKGRMMGKI